MDHSGFRWGGDVGAKLVASLLRRGCTPTARDINPAAAPTAARSGAAVRAAMSTTDAGEAPR